MLRLLLGSLLFLASPWLLFATDLTLEEEPGVYVRVRAADGMAIHDACFVFVEVGKEGCDDDGDGYIFFHGLPAGDYIVRQTTGAEGYLTAGDFPYQHVPSIHDRFIDVVLAPRTDDSSAAVDIALRAIDPGHGTSTALGCLILHGGSDEGCDEDGDGRITFEGVAPGSYLVEETLTPDGAIPLVPQWIGVESSGEITVTRTATGQYDNGGTVDLAVLTRHDGTGSLLSGACYIIVDASIEGCDENGDGAVDFEGVPMGVYLLRQTVAPSGHDLVGEFWIDVANLAPSHDVVVKQASTQHDVDHRHVSFDFYLNDDLTTVPGQVCLVVVGASSEGCDDNGDGTVDFLDVPVGTWELQFTQLPGGYEPAYDAYEITVSPHDPFSQVHYPIGLSPQQ